MSILRKAILLPLAASGLSLLGLAPAQAQMGLTPSATQAIVLSPEAAGYTSYICPNGDNSFTSDTSFAGYAASAFITNGVSHVKSADFVFDTCFGGGFLSTLTASFGSAVDWVGASGSSYLECANGNDNGGLFTVPLDVAMTNDYKANGANSTTALLSDLAYARNNDTGGPVASTAPIETPQITYANGGDTARFNDVSAGGQHYAIIWGGIVESTKTEEYIGFRKDVDAMYAQMTNSWGLANSHIYVLYPTTSATRALGGRVAHLP